MSGSLEKLERALNRIGQDAETREALTRLLLDFEARANYSGGSVRDDVTGPVFDALYHDAGLVRKTLQSGLVFEFPHTSKITRDFIMSKPEVPDHVWEPQTTRLLLYLSRDTRHVVIGGAYFGDQALLVAQQLAARQGVVHAFEPHEGNLNTLRHNVQLNGLTDNVKSSALGLWDEDTKLTLVGYDAYAFSAPAADADNGFATTTIDTYAEQEGITGQIGVIMIDTEGGELKGFQGAEYHLRLPAPQAPHLIFEIHRHYVDWSDGLHNTDIVKYLHSLGYVIYSVRDFHSNYAMSHLPIELVPLEETYLEGPPHGLNMVAVKDPTILQNDLFKLTHHVSPKLLWHKDPTLHHPTTS